MIGVIILIMYFMVGVCLWMVQMIIDMLCNRISKLDDMDTGRYRKLYDISRKLKSNAPSYSGLLFLCLTLWPIGLLFTGVELLVLVVSASVRSSIIEGPMDAFIDWLADRYKN